MFLLAFVLFSIGDWWSVWWCDMGIVHACKLESLFAFCFYPHFCRRFLMCHVCGPISFQTSQRREAEARSPWRRWSTMSQQSLEVGWSAVHANTHHHDLQTPQHTIPIWPVLICPLILGQRDWKYWFLSASKAVSLFTTTYAAIWSLANAAVWWLWWICSGLLCVSQVWWLQWCSPPSAPWGWSSASCTCTGGLRLNLAWLRKKSTVAAWTPTLHTHTGLSQTSKSPPGTIRSTSSEHVGGFADWANLTVLDEVKNKNCLPLSKCHPKAF